MQMMAQATRDAMAGLLSFFVEGVSLVGCSGALSSC